MHYSRIIRPRIMKGSRTSTVEMVCHIDIYLWNYVIHKNITLCEQCQGVFCAKRQTHESNQYWKDSCQATPPLRSTLPRRGISGGVFQFPSIKGNAFVGDATLSVLHVPNLHCVTVCALELYPRDAEGSVPYRVYRNIQTTNKTGVLLYYDTPVPY